MWPKRSKKAITMIELISTMVVLGLVVSALMGVLAQVTRRAAFSDNTARLVFYTTGLMEELSGRCFDQNSAGCANGASFSALGRDANEVVSNRNTFNDIDDYIGCTDARVVSPGSGIGRSVNVAYVSLSGNAWAVNATVPASGCAYKRVIVTVSRNNATETLTKIFGECK